MDQTGFVSSLSKENSHQVSKVKGRRQFPSKPSEERTFQHDKSASTPKMTFSSCLLPIKPVFHAEEPCLWPHSDVPSSQPHEVRYFTCAACPSRERASGLYIATYVRLLELFVVPHCVIHPPSNRHHTPENRRKFHLFFTFKHIAYFLMFCWFPFNFF